MKKENKKTFSANLLVINQIENKNCKNTTENAADEREHEKQKILEQHSDVMFIRCNLTQNAITNEVNWRTKNFNIVQII